MSFFSIILLFLLDCFGKETMLLATQIPALMLLTTRVVILPQKAIVYAKSLKTLPFALLFQKI